MAWYEILGVVLASLGGVGGLYKLYTAGVNKDGLVISNFKELVDEIKDHHETYKKDNDDRYSVLISEVEGMKKRINNQQKVIGRAWLCPLPNKDNQCPIIEGMEKIESCSKCNSK